MGDPETQPIMARLESDLVPALDKAIDGKLDEVELTWDRRIALGVVLAAANYPENPKTGAAITGIPVETTFMRVPKYRMVSSAPRVAEYCALLV
jgi:phosphoribosylamine--glycine ligase